MSRKPKPGLGTRNSYWCQCERSVMLGRRLASKQRRRRRVALMWPLPGDGLMAWHFVVHSVEWQVAFCNL